MGIAEGIKDIVQDIVSSRDARTSEIEGLKKEVRTMRSGFQSSRKKMGSALKKDLAQGAAARKSGTHVMLKDLAQGAAARKSGTHVMLNDFQKSHNKMSTQLRKDLDNFDHGIKIEVAGMRSGFQSSHKKMGSALKKDLAQGAAARKSGTHVMLKDLAQGAAARKSGTHVMLNDFQKSHNKMSTQLRKDLANFDHGIKIEVAGMRQETKADLGEARIAWQGLNRGAKKANATVKAKAKSKVVKANGKKKAAPVKDEPYDMETRLLAAIREQPGGITMTEASENLNIAPIVFRHISRKLLDEGKIRREDDIYFPAS